MIYNLSEFSKIDYALNYFKNSSHNDFIEFLKNDDEVLKQIALLSIDNIFSKCEADLILNCLTEHSSETREYCSFLINRLFQNETNRELFSGQNVVDKFSLAISDVNPKVCRNILEILPYFKKINILFPLLLKNSFSFIEKLQEKNKNKNYQYNTYSFRLYWNIFALGYTITNEFFNLYKNELINLISLCFEFKEYTLREKAAYLSLRINKITNSEKVEILVNKFKSDENFFVKEILISNLK